MDFDEDEHLPEQFKSLVLVRELDYSDDIRQCPTCGTYYKCTWDTDNDIFCPTHTGEYTQISKENAEQILRDDEISRNKRIQNTRKSMRRVHRDRFRSLNQDELTLLDFIISQLRLYVYWEDMVQGLDMPKDRIQKALAHLVEMQIISKRDSGEWPAYSLLTVRLY